jgi:nucleoside-diphosphate-sugar epimerase
LEYGNKTGICIESEKNQPHNYFSWVKQSLADYYTLFCKENNIKMIWFRIFYVYGFGQRPGSLIPSLIASFKNGDRPKLNNPSAVNDYVYIDDLVEAFVLAIKNSEAEGIINIGSGITTPTYIIAGILEKLVCNSEFFFHQLQEEVRNLPTTPGFYADTRLGKSALDWIPKWGISYGVEQMYKSTFSQ